MRGFGADVIRVKGNYDNSLNECIKQSKENDWQIVQDVAWEDYKLVPKLTMAGSVSYTHLTLPTTPYV